MLFLFTDKSDIPLGFIPSFRFDLTKITFQLYIADLGIWIFRSFHSACKKNYETLKPNPVKLLNLKT